MDIKIEKLVKFIKIIILNLYVCVIFILINLKLTFDIIFEELKKKSIDYSLSLLVFINFFS
jgi:hypothetical protein